MSPADLTAAQAAQLRAVLDFMATQPRRAFVRVKNPDPPGEVDYAYRTGNLASPVGFLMGDAYDPACEGDPLERVVRRFPAIAAALGYQGLTAGEIVAHETFLRELEGVYWNEGPAALIARFQGD